MFNPDHIPQDNPSDPRFDQIGTTAPQYAPYADPHPYGPPATPVTKAGLTKRGKIGLGIAAGALTCTVFTGYQISASNQAEADTKRAELALQSQALELAKLRELNKNADADKQAAKGAAKTRQASVDACVRDSKNLVAKTGFGTSYADIVDACQTQYTDPTAPVGDSDLDAVAAESSLGNSSIPVSSQTLGIGAVAAAGLFVYGVRKGRKKTT